MYHEMMGQVNRRQLLRITGAAVVGPTASSIAAGIDVGRFNIGTTKSGKVAIESQAEEIYRIINLEGIGYIVTAQLSTHAQGTLENRQDVRYVEPDFPVYEFEHATDGGNGDPYQEQVLPWGIDRIDAEIATHDGVSGSGGSIAIIDSGIDPEHEDVDVVGGTSFVDCEPEEGECTENWADDSNHGTHCAGIATGENNDIGVIGVAPDLDVFAVKVLDWRGAGFSSDVAAGIKWTADQNIDVGSLSLGGLIENSTLKEACSYAYNRGVLLVAAAGNNGPLDDTVGYPAGYEEVIAVSSINGEDEIVDDSSRGTEIELAAPGEDILSSIPENHEYDRFSGTSMACPHVSATGALLMANGYAHANDTESYESPGGARGRLRYTAEDIGLSASEQGYGLVNVPLALNIILKVATGNANPGETQATVTANLLGSDGETIDCYFEWRRNDSDSWNETTIQTLKEPGAFEETITGLETGTEYIYRAVGKVGDRVNRGNYNTFQTANSGTLLTSITAE